VALKKPADFFGNTKKTPLDEVKEEYTAASPQKIEQVSEAFDAFKTNLNHIQSLSDFTSTFDSFKENLEKVENVSIEVGGIKEDIKNLIKQEDLDSAMMAQLLFVEQSISKIESKISSINGETVDKIKDDFSGLSTAVEGFLSIDVPKYKKLISESEVRVDERFGDFKEQVEENLDTIKADINKEVTTALSEVESLNQNTIDTVREEFKETAKDLNKNVNNLVEEEFPKYKKFFAETEVRTEEKIKNSIDSYKEDIENLTAKVKLFTETEIPKYSNLLIETKLKSEQEVKDLEEEVLSRVNNLTEKVQSISEGIPEKTSEKIQELQTVIDEYKGEIDSISKTYQNLYKDIEKYYKRFNFLEETVNEDLREIQTVLIESNETYHASLKTEVGKFRNKISEQMKGLEMDLTVNEKHIKKQNEHIENIQEEIKEVLERLQLDKLEEKNKELVEKINYLEETISEINEKKLLTEDNPTLPGDPSTNNSADPLTPLDQKFVTLDQLQNHYRTFINRVQQQIATIGGGGAGVMHDLDDVTFDRTTGQGQLLIYNGAKWVGIASTAVGGGDVDELAENCTGTNLTLSGNLSVTGDITYDEANARNWNVSGIATVGTAFYMPQYTTTDRDAATFNEGAMIYNTTTKKVEFYNGTSWIALPGMSLGLTVALDG
jgi:chromosome segregation ATPase